MWSPLVLSVVSIDTATGAAAGAAQQPTSTAMASTIRIELFLRSQYECTHRAANAKGDSQRDVHDRSRTFCHSERSEESAESRAGARRFLAALGMTGKRLRQFRL